MAVIGIDLGTTNSLVSVYRNGRTELIPNELGQYMTPSCVSLMEDGSLAVGAVAKERLITHPERTAVAFKTWMGTEKAFSLGDRAFLPHELSAMVLKKLAQSARAALGEEIEEAVISVPAYFNDNQRCATRLAAQLAGLPVKRLINEPSAAALCYSEALHRQEGKLLVVDFGGGTLDVSVVDCFENMVEILAIAGDNHLGGNDIDQAIAVVKGQIEPVIPLDIDIQNVPGNRGRLVDGKSFCELLIQIESGKALCTILDGLFAIVRQINAKRFLEGRQNGLSRRLERTIR